MSEVEIIVTGKNLAKAAFASAATDVDVVKKRAADLALTLRRAELASASAGTAAQRAFATAAAAADKAAASAKLAADAQDKLARGEISAEEAAKADAVAQEEAAKATDAAARAALAAERASVAQATAAKRAGEESAASAELAAAGSGRMAAGMDKLRSVGKVALEGLLVGTAAVGVESVKAAMRFDQAMELIHTQGGVAQGQIKQLSDGVLHLAGVVGQSPDSLAESLYHVESNFAGMGISADKALGLVKIAAEGARVGNANLVDVTNALTAAVASQIPGVGDLNSAMGILNATVGSGDMKMQDLADAMGTGMVAVVKGYGLSITDVGAALAVFGDNNIRGAVAGTQLRMAVQALAVPAKSAGGALKDLGMTSDQMAKDMQTGGLNKALTDLVDHMNNAGITAQQQGQIITELFGKKAGTGVAILVEQFKRLQSKYKDLHQAGNEFGSAWDATQKQFSTAWAKMQDSVKALMIQLGEKLIPVITHVIDWFNKHTTAVKILAGVIGGILLTAVAAYVVEMTAAAVATVAATWPILAVLAAIGLLIGGLIYAYDHSKKFREIVKEVGREVKLAWDASMKAAGKAIKDFENGPLKDIEKKIKEYEKNIQTNLKNVEKWWHENGAAIMRDVKLYWAFIKAEIGVTMALILLTVRVVLLNLKNLWTAVWMAIKNATKLVLDTTMGFVTLVMHAIHNVISVILDAIHGKWGAVWNDLKRLCGQALHDAFNLVNSILTDAGSMMFNAGQHLIQMLISGIQSMFSAATGAVSSIVGAISGMLPHSPAKTGPLSGEGSPDKSGARIGRMLADGMNSSRAVVGVAAANLAHVAHEQHMQHLRHLQRGHHPGRHHRAGHPAAAGPPRADQAPFVGDQSWTAGGVRYTVGRPGSGEGGSSGGYAGGGSSGGGGTQEVRVVIEFDFKNTGGSAYERALIELIRHAVRVRGGNAQKVLGH